MSKVGKKPVLIKEGVTVTKSDQTVLIRGPLGEAKFTLPAGLEIEIGDREVYLRRLSEIKKIKASHGTFARLLANAIQGTTTGFSKTLEVVGTGYRAQMEDNDLVLFLGFSHPVRFPVPEGVKIEVQENKIRVSGVDKELVGRVSDKIRKIKKPDAYKGKGIIYAGEKLKLKPGKAAAKAGVVVGK